ncbi:MAG TPA: A/G-specific adenine glycosylase [Chitinophagaceae bacterium]|nr:A/G-specific adenine glycosylase [Chitinophagaceae bacterium]
MQKLGKKAGKSTFSDLLLEWNKTKNDRKMPWKGEKDPYKIWLSEIILQQTRVEQGLGYYQRFIETFPDILALAAAPDAQVFKLWEGLGYYSRCRNLLQTARHIASANKGIFPDSYEEILALKGVGPYTAAAISSFAFNLPYAVVDGNVFRVLARVFGLAVAIDSGEGKKKFSDLASQLLDKKKAGLYNQAIMDFGATLCKPAAPVCHNCPFNTTCHAYLNDEVDMLPVKEKKINIRNRWFYYLVLEKGDKTMIRQRTSKDIWNQLYEFPMIEAAGEEPVPTILERAEAAGWLKAKNYEVVTVSPMRKQQLSHQLIAGRFIRIRILKQPTAKTDGEWVTGKEFESYSFPKFIRQYLDDTTEQSLF